MAIRVVQVVLSLEPGGTERLVIEIAKRLAPEVEMVVCCLDGAGNWASELTERGIPVCALQRRPGFHPSIGYRIARVAARHGASLLHCHHYSPFVYGRVAALLRPGLRLVFTEHGRLSGTPPRLKRKLVNPVLARLPGELYAVSASLRQHLIAEGFPPGRLGVIHNGIDPGPLTTDTDRRVARQMLGIPDCTLLVGTAGRLDSVKDLPTLVEAFAAFRSMVKKPAALVMIGEGPERAQLEEKVRTLGLAEDVCFAGYRSDIQRLLPALDLYVNSSIHEGISLTILEAMAASVPVIATRVGGTLEVVVDRETGLLVPARRPEALAEAMLALAQADERRSSIGAAGRTRVERHFTIDRMVEEYYRAYCAAVGC